MTSWDDALLILNGWRDKPAHVEFLTVVPDGVDEDGETIFVAHGPTGLIKGVRPKTKVMDCEDGSGQQFEIDLQGAKFEYDDTKRSPFPDSRADLWVCFLEVTLRDGTRLVLAELADFSEDTN